MIKYKAITFQECVDCDAPIKDRRELEEPTTYLYEDYEVDGIPVFCIDEGTVQCYRCSTNQ